MRGRSPRALKRSTCTTRPFRSGDWSSTYTSGVFETIPPSQYASPSISTGANAGGSAALAITWCRLIFSRELSKYFEFPLATFTAPPLACSSAVAPASTALPPTCCASVGTIGRNAGSTTPDVLL